MIVCVDTETSGLSPGAHQVLEIAAVLADGQTLEELECLELKVKLRKNSQVSAKAMAVNGIDPFASEWLSQAIDGGPAIEALNKMLARAHVILGHNVAFDLRFLAAEAQAFGAAWAPPRSVCTKELASALLAKTGKTPSAKLADVCTYFGIPNSGAHRALADVRRTLQAYKHLSKLEQPPAEQSSATLDQIHAQRMQDELPECRLCGAKIIRCGHHWSNAKPGAYSRPDPPPSDPAANARAARVRAAGEAWGRRSDMVPAQAKQHSEGDLKDTTQPATVATQLPLWLK